MIDHDHELEPGVCTSCHALTDETGACMCASAAALTDASPLTAADIDRRVAQLDGALRRLLGDLYSPAFAVRYLTDVRAALESAVPCCESCGGDVPDAGWDHCPACIAGVEVAT